jgi:hypothetical protein
VLVHTCTDNYVIFNKQTGSFDSSVNKDAGNMYITSNQQTKPMSLRETVRKINKSTVPGNAPGKSLVAFHGIHHHVLTAGIHVWPRERMRAMVLI